MIRHSHSTSSPPKPRRRLPRSPSDPSRLDVDMTTPSDESPNQQIYVLSADGSSLFLLDPSNPSAHEEPPPYAPFRSQSEDAVPRAADAGPSSPRAGLNIVPFPTLITPDAPQQRHRSSSVSASLQRNSNSLSPDRPRYRTHNSFSHRVRSSRDLPRSAVSSPGLASTQLADERTPLLTRQASDEWVEIQMPNRRGLWRAIFCGELEEGQVDNTWKAGWKRFWRPVGDGKYWKAMLHLWILNFPFALFVWPPLVVGTLAGTVLLITLPLGVAVWWLTLFISRSAARLETILQLNHHSPLHHSTPQPSYHPIFHRIRERSAPPSPTSIASELPPDMDIKWEKRFMKCSYAMFLDHYSYSALSYFLLIKPLIVLFSSIVLWALFPVSLALIFTLPIYLRAAKRWGRWQAEVAIENL